MPIVKAGRSTGLLSKDGNPYTDYSAVAGVPGERYYTERGARRIRQEQPALSR